MAFPLALRASGRVLRALRPVPDGHGLAVTPANANSKMCDMYTCWHNYMKGRANALPSVDQPGRAVRRLAGQEG